jgi:dTDP-4-amino-4,6-dideoxygalactose transaminase
MTEKHTPIPNTDLKAGYLNYRKEIDSAIRRVLESGWYILGKEVLAFEEEFASWCGAKHCVSVANGTDAIIVGLRALGIGEGDAVFTVSHTAVATVAAIELVGATPVLVDIEPDNFTIDPVKLEAAIREQRAKGAARPRAVIGVHIYGNLFDVIAVKKICEREGMKLIEDCAQAHGATLNDQPVGTLADLATFSFYPTKNLGAFGDGGALVTNDGTVATTAAAIRQYGWYERYLSDITGMNSRLDELQAAILRIRLKHLDEEVAKRRHVAALYDDALRNVVVTPAVRKAGVHAYHLYVIRTPDRTSVAARLKDANIATAVHYPVPIHQQKAYQGRIRINEGGLPETERAAAEVLSLPMHPFLRDEEVQRVADVLRGIAS